MISPLLEVNLMRYAQFGDTGLIVSKLAFGAMTFGEGVLVGELVNKVDQYLADRMVHTCIDAGVNLFDTADMYTSGQSEIMLGKEDLQKIEGLTATQPPYPAWMQPMGIDMLTSEALKQ